MWPSPFSGQNECKAFAVAKVDQIFGLLLYVIKKQSHNLVTLVWTQNLLDQFSGNIFLEKQISDSEAVS
jgi:hypothetical protein